MTPCLEAESARRTGAGLGLSNRRVIGVHSWLRESTQFGRASFIITIGVDARPIVARRDQLVNSDHTRVSRSIVPVVRACLRVPSDVP